MRNFDRFGNRKICDYKSLREGGFFLQIKFGDISLPYVFLFLENRNKVNSNWFHKINTLYFF